MKSLLLAAILLLLASQTLSASNEALVGLWKSDSELTIASYKSSKSVSPEGERALDEMFGKLTLNFGSEEVQVDRGIAGVEVVSTPYRISESDAEHVVIEFINPDGSIDEIAEYHFEGQCIKRKQPDKEWHEYFCRVQ